MKIVSLRAENIKKLSAVYIRPDGNVVQITGKNGQGKSSILDSIWWCLAGAGTIQSAPIRKGQQRALIRLDLGELVVIRTFTRKGENEYTTKISVETADGGLLKSPQAVLDGLLGTLAFDPLAFSRMKPKEQFDALRQFVPGIDFEKVDAQNRGDTERRTEVSRLAREAKAAASMIIVPDDAPAEGVDEAALVKELQEAGEHNASEAQRAANRTTAVARVEQLRKDARTALDGVGREVELAIQHRDASIKDLERQIEALQKRIEDAKVATSARIDEIRADAQSRSDTANADADALQARIDKAEPINEIDTAPLMARITKARETNAAVARAAERAKHVNTANKYEAEAKGLSDKIDARNKAKRDAIAAAKMPVPGLDFGDGVVLLNGVPFDQASDAQRLQTSVAIAMAANPKLRVIRIRDGSLLDEDAMKLLAEMADQHDMQCWIERVDSSGAVGFVLEDGHLKDAKVAADEEGAAA